MAKPFSIQAPEEIAKEYAGNKQKIAQAAQMGLVDPTAAVLAGMFIDRMRSAQVMEAAQQPTVAQQVLGGGGVPPLPGNASPMAQATLTSPPPPMMGAQMGTPAPAPAPMEAPMGMAMGGIAGLPVPDAMFDEPDNGGYSGGGLVAFGPGGSTGGMADYYDDVEYVESRGDPNALSSKGARGVMQLMPGTMRDPGFGVPTMDEMRKQGLSEEEANRKVGQKYLDAMYKRYGDRKLALMAYNWGPGNVDKWLKAGSPPDRVPKETRDYVNKVTRGKSAITASGVRDRDMSSAPGMAMSLDDFVRAGREMMAPTDEYTAANDAARARLQEMGSDEYYEKQRKDSMWETLASIGFNMASSKSPYILQAISEAAAAALPGAQADKKERKQLKDRAIAGLRDLAEGDMRLAQEGFKVGVEMWKSMQQQQQFDEKMEFERQVSKEELAIARREVEAQMAAAMNKGMGYQETLLSMFTSGDPALKQAAIEWVNLNKEGQGGGLEGVLGLKGQSAENPYAGFSATRN